MTYPPPIDTQDPAEMRYLIDAFRAEARANEALIDNLETKLAAMRSEHNVPELLRQLSATQMQLAEAQAAIDSLRPWARIGKKAIFENWYTVDIGDGWLSFLRCCGAHGWGSDAVHAADCPIPALLDQLDSPRSEGK